MYRNGHRKINPYYPAVKIEQVEYLSQAPVDSSDAKFLRTCNALRRSSTNLTNRGDVYLQHWWVVSVKTLGPITDFVGS